MPGLQALDVIGEDAVEKVRSVTTRDAEESPGGHIQEESPVRGACGVFQGDVTEGDDFAAGFQWAKACAGGFVAFSQGAVLHGGRS